MKFSSKFSSIFIFLFFAFFLQAQEEEPANKETENTSEYHNVSGGSVYSDDLEVENIYFWKSFAPSGRGEFLEFSFDIVNKTDVDIPLKLFVVGFFETDETESKHRMYIEYPEWRERDYDAEQKKIVFLESIPEVSPEEVSKWAGVEVKEEEKTRRKRRTTYQSFLDYINYIEQNPDAGVDVMLQGMENTTTQTNEGDNYNVVSKSLKTSIWTHLYSRRKSDQRFFNHVGVVLYDVEEKKVIYRQFFTFTGKFNVQ